MAYDKLPTKQIKVTLAEATIDQLLELMRKGRHGTSLTDVAKTLIEEGLRLASEKGHLADK
jgi:hypothetical protein